MDERLGAIEAKLDRLLALLDAKELKKQKDRVRIKEKRDEEAAAAAILAGKLVWRTSRARWNSTRGSRTTSGRTSCSNFAKATTFCAG